MTGNVVIFIAFPLFIFPKPTLSGNPFFQPPCALAFLLCAWRLFRVLGSGGAVEVDYMETDDRGGAMAGALLRQSRDVAGVLAEMFLPPCALLRKAERIALDFYTTR